MLCAKKGSVVDGPHLHYLNYRVNPNLNAEEACLIQAWAVSLRIWVFCVQILVRKSG